jgi:hypothetical protein
MFLSSVPGTLLLIPFALENDLLTETTPVEVAIALRGIRFDYVDATDNFDPLLHGPEAAG